MQENSRPEACSPAYEDTLVHSHRKGLCVFPGMLGTFSTQHLHFCLRLGHQVSPPEQYVRKTVKPQGCEKGNERKAAGSREKHSSLIVSNEIFNSSWLVCTEWSVMGIRPTWVAQTHDEGCYFLGFQGRGWFRRIRESRLPFLKFEVYYHTVCYYKCFQMTCNQLLYNRGGECGRWTVTHLRVDYFSSESYDFLRSRNQISSMIRMSVTWFFY